MFLPFREGGKLGTFNYKQINPFAKYGFIPRELVTPLRLPHRLEPPRRVRLAVHRIAWIRDTRPRRRRCTRKRGNLKRLYQPFG